MAVRVCLQTSDADSQLILGDGNSAARLLSRPGEAIYNDANGLAEGNDLFQTVPNLLPTDAAFSSVENLAKNTSNPQFGQVFATRRARETQFGLKFGF